MKEKGQEDLKQDWVKTFMTGSRLKVKVSRVCIGNKDILEMIQESHKRVTPGYTQLVLADRKGSSQAHFDNWLVTLRTAYPLQNVGFCINSKCTPADILEVILNHSYYSTHQQHLRHLNKHFKSTHPLFNSHY